MAQQAETRRWQYVSARGNPTVEIQEGAEVLTTLDDGAEPDKSAGHVKTRVTFKNNTDVEQQVFWVDFGGGFVLYQTLAPGHSYKQSTYAGHVWVIRGKAGPDWKRGRRHGEDGFSSSDSSESSSSDSSEDESRANRRADKRAQRKEQRQKKRTARRLNHKELVGKYSDSPVCWPGGTVWFSKELIRPDDPSAFVGFKEDTPGKGRRTMFDRRETRGSKWVKHNAWILNAVFGHETRSKVIEVQANPEFSAEEAMEKAELFCKAIGRIPAFLLKDADSIWLHKGTGSFGGGNRNFLIYADCKKDGYLEATFVHEGTHTSVDSYHKDSDGWLRAQEEDNCFVSNYAKDWPDREDLSETMGPYLAVRFRSDRVEADKIKKVEEKLAARIRYLDGLGLSMDIWK